MLHQDIMSPGPLEPKNQAKFVLEAIYKKGGVFKYPKVFQYGSGPKFKREVTKLLEKHNVNIRRSIMKYKHTHTAFAKAFNKELEKLLFRPMDPKSFKTLKNYQQFGLKV